MTDAGWLAPEQWALVQRSVPIFCVDALVTRSLDGEPACGLILREQPGAGLRWCLVGGRVLLDESVEEALNRHWQSTFAPQFRLGAPLVGGPHVVEYRRGAHASGLFDPRQHAVSATFVVEAVGEPAVLAGEAHDFRWVTSADIDGTDVGFGQTDLIRRLMGPLGWV